MDFSQDRTQELAPRFFFGYALLAVLFLFVLFRLAFLQVVKGDFFWILSSEHTVKEIRILAPRGLLLDRNLVPLAENRPSYDLAVIFQYLRSRKEVEKSLARIAEIHPPTYQERWKWQRKSPAFFPLTLLSDVPYDVAARVRTAKVISLGSPDPYDLRGIEIVAHPLRSYPQRSLLGATLGHLGEVSESQLARGQGEERYFLGDLAGAAGLEKHWEGLLRGRDGYIRKVVDAAGREGSSDELKELLKDVPAVAGSSLVLTVDGRLQKFAEEQFGEKPGSLVALDPGTGEILALVSLPSFDPSTLLVNVSPGTWQKLVSDPRKLFLHRALHGHPPG